MQHYKNWQLLLLAWLIFTITGCSSLYNTHPDRVGSSAYLNKQMPLTHDMVLAETKPLNPLMNSRYWLFTLSNQSYYNNYLNMRLPTDVAYKQEPARWSQWTGSTLIGWSRLSGLISRGTLIEIIDIAAKTEGGGYWVTVEIKEGKFKGTHAIYGNPQAIVPGMYR